MLLTIVAPWGNVCKTTVESVTLPSVEGSFTVLHSHAPIIAQLRDGDVTYVEESGKENRVTIESGFVRVVNDNVEVCVEMENPEQ